MTNPGGPGGSGVELVRDAVTSVPGEILRSFDIVSWDPRGLGPIRRWSVSTISTASTPSIAIRVAHAQVAQNVEASRARRACETVGRPASVSVDPEATVRDLDAIRAAMGEEQVSYLGFSYGT